MSNSTQRLVPLPDPGQEADERRIAFGAAGTGIATLVLTSVHHAYGAYVYTTPWRLHVLNVAVPAVAGVAALYAVLRSSASPGLRRVAAMVMALLVLAVPFGMFGLFEGAYNHVLKNLLYFGGAPDDVLRLLFPPPAYELPNDVFFEITGVIQTVPALVSGMGALMLLWRTVVSRRTAAAGLHQWAVERSADRPITQ